MHEIESTCRFASGVAVVGGKMDDKSRVSLKEIHRSTGGHKIVQIRAELVENGGRCLEDNDVGHVRRQRGQ